MLSVLEVRDLVVFREGRALIAPVTFSLAMGEIIRVVGDNGSGKTTLIEAILGLHRQWTGLVKVGVRDFSYKRQVVPAFYSLSFAEVTSLVVGFDRKSFGRICEALRLGYLMSRPIGVLSGGETQRVMIALALLRRHELLVLDEPFGGVDKESLQLITDCILFESSTRAIVIVEHRASMSLGAVRTLLLDQPVN